MVMKVVHVPFTWLPDALGGTEVYVQGLLRGLSQAGLEQLVVATVNDGPEVEPGVRRIRPMQQPSLPQLYGEGDERSAADFYRILSREKPDVVHFHAMTPTVSLRWLEQARRVGAACVFTHHSATFSCPRGTLMWRGRKPCEVAPSALECSACLFQGRGLPDLLAKPAAALTWFGRWWPQGRAASQILPLLQRRGRSLRRWLDGMDAIVVLCDWSRRLMEQRLAVRPERLHLVRHAVDGAPSRLAQRPACDLGLRLGFFGRADPSKGLGLLLQAMALQPDLALRLEVYLVGDEQSRRQAREAVGAVGMDERVQWCAALPPAEVPAAMARCDVVVVPSQWMETGPLVVLEALNAGVPVLGSNLGGIAEWLRHDLDGWLLSWNDAQAWADAFAQLCARPEILARWQQTLRGPGSCAEWIGAVLQVYEKAIHQRGGDAR